MNHQHADLYWYEMREDRRYEVVGANFSGTFLPGDRISMEHVLNWLENDEDFRGELHLQNVKDSIGPVKEQGSLKVFLFFKNLTFFTPFVFLPNLLFLFRSWKKNS